MSNFVSTNRSVHPQVTINVETHEMIDIPKEDPEWPDTVSSNFGKSVHGNQVKYAV